WPGVGHRDRDRGRRGRRDGSPEVRRMMHGGRGRRLVVLALVALASGTVLDSTDAVRSAGAAGSRAVVNIGGSNQVISFGSTVTGLQALRMVASVTTVGFGGTGEAVCSINGVGNPATPGECLVGPNGEYWSYWRAAPGAAGWQYSSRGAGGTTVTDGWVEGWRYGTGGPPPFTSFCAVAGCAPPPTAPPPPPTAQPSTEAPTVAGSSATAPGASGDGTTSPSGSGRADPGAPGEDSSGEDSSGEEGSTRTRAAGAGDRDETLASGTSSRGDGDGGSSPIGVMAAGAVIAALGAGGVVLRRRRRAPVAPG
ncbi:MAG: hypothetical protein R6X23_00215, partial [Acidimicrobiia bacterium]